MQFAVLGTGSWGTALAILLARNGHNVGLFGRDESEIRELSQHRTNERYLPGVKIPTEVAIGRLGEPIGEPEVWILAVPSTAIRSVCSKLPSGKIHVVLASKGMEAPSGTLLSEVVNEACPNAVVGAISGPNLAREVIAGIPTATLSACHDESAARKVCNALNSATFRAYYSDDLIGVELAGALKNVLAIGAGISDGLGFGDNTKGALLARGLRDMASLGLAMGARIETFFGIAGVGDLFATAHSKLSRNYRVGYGIGQGKALDDVLLEIGQVAEGVQTSHCIDALSERYHIELPILRTIHRVLQNEMNAKDAVAALMNREPKRESIGECPPSV